MIKTVLGYFLMTLAAGIFLMIVGTSTEARSLDEFDPSVLSSPAITQNQSVLFLRRMDMRRVSLGLSAFVKDENLIEFAQHALENPDAKSLNSFQHMLGHAGYNTQQYIVLLFDKRDIKRDRSTVFKTFMKVRISDKIMQTKGMHIGTAEGKRYMSLVIAIPVSILEPGDRQEL